MNVQESPATSAQRRRSERVADAVVAGYINTISGRQHALGTPAAHSVRSPAAADSGRIRLGGARRPRAPRR
jgi:hypothetical protein